MKNTTINLDLKDHKAKLDREAERKRIKPTTLARIIILNHLDRKGK